MKYRVLAGDCTNDCGAAVAQVNLGFDEWEVSGVTFTQNNGSPDTNLCTDSPNLVEWALIDGPGGILAQVFVCRNPATKAILGFRIEFDSGDIWSDSGDGGKFDIRAVAAHEAGHATGLGHVNSPGASRSHDVQRYRHGRFRAGDAGVWGSARGERPLRHQPGLH